MNPSDDDTKCSICLEPMNEPLTTVTLRCGHVFHGQCIADSLRINSRCPLCRDTPNDGYDSDSEWVEANPPPHRISFSEAISLARTEARTQKGIKRSFDTINKWKTIATEANKELRETRDAIRPLEDSLDKKIEAYSDKLWSTFEKKNKDLIQRHDDAKRRKRHATSYT